MGRRLWAVALAGVVSMVGVMGAPATARAAANWLREVRFEPVPAEPDLLVHWNHNGPQQPATSATGCGIQGDYRTVLGFQQASGASPNFGSTVTVTGIPTCRWSTSGNIVHHWSLADGSHPTGSSNVYRVKVTWCGDSGKSLAVGRGTGVHGQPHTIMGYEAVWTETNPQASCQHASAAGQTNEVDITLGAASTLVLEARGGYVYFAAIDIYLIAPGVEGSCEGAPGAAGSGDGGLVWGSAGITSSTHSTGWGDVYAEVSPSAACLFMRDGVITYRPPEGVTKGETHTFGVEVSASTGQTARVIVQWACLSNGQAYGVIDHSWSGPNPGGATGGGAELQKSNAPADNACIQIVVLEGTFLHGLYLGNVEGDPLLDICDGEEFNPYDPNSGGDPPECSPGPDVGGGGNPNDPFGHCVPGSDFLAVGEWVAYAACLIAAIPGAVASFIGILLRDMFIPTRLGQRWAAFMDLMETKVPFGWFAQVSAAITAGLAGTGSLPSLALFGVSVTAPLSSALAAMAPYRGLLLAGVALVMVTGCLRWIMAAVGVSPSHSGGGDAS